MLDDKYARQFIIVTSKFIDKFDQLIMTLNNRFYTNLKGNNHKFTVINVNIWSEIKFNFYN